MQALEARMKVHMIGAGPAGLYFAILAKKAWPHLRITNRSNAWQCAEIVSARTFGYGASPGMARRCMERLDHAGIPGEVRVLRALSDTQPVGTQGPVWYVGGKAV